MINLREHDVGMDFAKDLWRANMVGMAALNLETSSCKSDFHKSFYNQSLMKMVGAIKQLDRHVGTAARNYTISVLLDQVYISDPTDLELFRACLFSYAWFRDSWSN